MGEIIPPEKPIFESSKFYCVDTIAWRADGGGCYVIFDGAYRCCILGSGLQWLYENNKVCSAGWHICGGYTPSYDSIENIVGPYDTIEECVTACP